MAKEDTMMRLLFHLGIALILSAGLVSESMPSQAAGDSQSLATHWYQKPPYYSWPDPTYGSAGLVAVAEVEDRFTSGPPPSEVPGPSNVYYKARLVRVLKGDRHEDGVVVIWSAGSRYLPRLDKGYVGVFGLRAVPGGVFVATAIPYRITRPHVPLPDPAPVQDKVILLLMATAETADTSQAAAVIARLQRLGATLDSPYYDLYEWLGRIQARRPELTKAVLSARRRFGDTGALAEWLRFHESLSTPPAKIAVSFEGLETEDVVTTLNLILEGKRWPWLAPSRKSAIIQIQKIAHPSSLPYLVAALDDPDHRIQYYAYTAIEAILGRRPVTPLSEFFDRSKSMLFEKGSVLSSDALQKIEEMKQWWETEGKRQFDYVLPNQK